VRRSPVDLWGYLTTFVHLIHWYLTQLFCPSGIVLIWSSKIIEQNGWHWVAMGVLWLGFYAYAYLRSREIPAGRLGLVWLAIGFLPMMLGCFHRSSVNLVVEPYWFAFSSMGFFLFVAALFTDLFSRMDWKIPAVFLCLTAVGWTSSGQIYNHMWEDDRVYSQYYVQHAGDYTPSNMFAANVFLRHHELSMAETYMLRSHQEQLIMDAPRYFADLGFIDFNHGRLTAAKENYLKAVALAPGYYPCYTYLGVIDFMQGDLAEAQKYFQFVIRQDASEVISRLDMGSIYKKRGEISAAVKMYREVLDIDPFSEIALVELFKIYLDQKDRLHALEMADRLLKRSRDPVVLRNTGLIYQYYGRNKSAREAFDKLRKYLKNK